MKNLLHAFVAAIALSVVAFAEKVEDGDYTYNDANGSKDAVVANDGEYMEVNGASFLYNDVTGAYDSQPAGASISFEDQGYRYNGQNSETGFCTLYPDQGTLPPGHM